MIKRVCPNCKSVWFSSDPNEDWKCSKCNALIPASLNESAEKVSSKEEYNIKNRE